VERLSEPQRALLATYGERWAQLRLSTLPGDRAAAEEGVARAYSAAGLAPPRTIVWCKGPVELARSWKVARSRNLGGENVRPLIVDTVRRRAEMAVDRALSLSAKTSIASESRLARLPPFCASIDEAVIRDCERVRTDMGTRLTSLFTLTRRSARLRFGACSFGFHSSAWLGVLEYLHDVCGLVRHTQALGGLWLLARNSGWILPHEHICWLSDRHNLLRQDTSGRLHSSNGPALGYPDGWLVYAWKGVLVPSWMIERPELITLSTIGAANDPQIRRCMIDILTPERFIEMGGALRVAQDETGILWRQRWRWETWAAVEVLNGTPAKDGTRKRYFLQVPATMRSPREAVAWTYGLTERRYNPIVRT
jgi:hypothetical protein